MSFEKEFLSVSLLDSLLVLPYDMNDRSFMERWKVKMVESRREEILDAAAKLFRRQGYSGTSMRQIARAAGYGTAVAGLYNHFENKEAIFVALVEQQAPYDDLLSALEDIEGDTAEAFLRNVFHALIPVMRARLDFLQLLIIDLQEFNGQIFGTFLQRILPHFTETLFKLLHFPEMRPDLKPQVIMRTIASMIIGYLFTELVASTPALERLSFPPALGEAWLDGLVSILIHGMTVSTEAKHA